MKSSEAGEDVPSRELDCGRRRFCKVYGRWTDALSNR
jgi:hypothetical protein